MTTQAVQTPAGLFTPGGRECPKNGEWVLRAMRWEDLPQVVAIEAHSQRDPWPQQSFRAELDNHGVSQPLVAVRKNEVAGYIVPWFIADEVQIANIAVKENFRRRGLGRAMLSWVLHLALARYCRKVCLEVRRSNVAARRLYENLGFVVEGIRRNYYGREREDAILMKKELVPKSNA